MRICYIVKHQITFCSQFESLLLQNDVIGQKFAGMDEGEQQKFITPRVIRCYGFMGNNATVGSASIFICNRLIFLIFSKSCL